MNPSYAGPVLSPLQAAARMRSGIALRVVVFMVRLTKWDDVVWTPLPSRARQSYDVSGAKGGRRPSLRPQKQVLRAARWREGPDRKSTRLNSSHIPLSP